MGTFSPLLAHSRVVQANTHTSDRNGTLTRATPRPRWINDSLKVRWIANQQVNCWRMWKTWIAKQADQISDRSNLFDRNAEGQNSGLVEIPRDRMEIWPKIRIWSRQNSQATNKKGRALRNNSKQGWDFRFVFIDRELLNCSRRFRNLLRWFIALTQIRRFNYLLLFRSIWEELFPRWNQIRCVSKCRPRNGDDELYFMHLLANTCHRLWHYCAAAVAKNERKICTRNANTHLVTVAQIDPLRKQLN